MLTSDSSPLTITFVSIHLQLGPIGLHDVVEVLELMLTDILFL